MKIRDRSKQFNFLFLFVFQKKNTPKTTKKQTKHKNVADSNL